jgi:hypothetical protein
MKRLGFADYSIIAEPFAAESIYQGQVHNNQRRSGALVKGEFV